MNQNRKIPVPGEFYRHFKNKLYQIIAVASHSETGEAMVVYQALYGEFKVWVRPLSMFMEEVDHEKYPEVTQKYRFARVVPEKAAESPETAFRGPAAGEFRAAGREGTPEDEACAGDYAEPGINPCLLEFLDALDTRNYDKKLECLAKLSGHVSQKELDDIYMVMDMQAQAGTVEDQLRAIRRQLMLLKKFDGERLR